MKTKLIVVAVLVLSLVQAIAGVALKDMVLVPAGSFMMGDTLDGRKDELPHSVYVSAFFMDKYEVTKTLWSEVFAWAIVHGYEFENPGTGEAENYPVNSISWHDATKWCNARSEKEGRTPAYYTSAAKTAVYRTGNLNMLNTWVKWNTGYRLPTEAEWEKSARGGLSGKRFPWGDTITHAHANYRSDKVDSYDVNPTRGFHPTYGGPSPVGSFAPNGYGLYDMAGNVSEWCWDKFDSPYSSDSQVDPRGLELGLRRIVRGGNWGDRAFWSRVALRAYVAGPPDWNKMIGFRTVLASTSPGPLQVIQTQPVQPAYAQFPNKEAGKDSLVVVTHGWIPKKDAQTSPPDPVWVDEMVEAIRSNLKTRGLNNWQVEPFKWKEKAWMTQGGLVTEEILNNAEKEGGSLGHFLASQGYARVHLIGHSAGAAAIQHSALILKSANVNTVVHTTFLDPYVGVRYGGKKKYGLAANWADNYFAWDATTYDHLFFGRTASKLEHAYNVDVGQLDQNKVSMGRYRSTGKGQVEECFETVTSHEWPHEFYLKTIPSIPLNPQQGSEGFGFALSQEGGNWDFALASYNKYEDPTRVLGTQDEPCPLLQDFPTPVFPSWMVDFSQTPVFTSPTGLIKNNGSWLVLTSGGQLQQQSLRAATTARSAWVTASIVATNVVNMVSFDVEFSSANNAGLLTVYWETNTIGSVDERVVVPGLQHYSYALPRTYTNGLYTLGFRLDSFTAETSSVMVTNVAIGFVGVSGPFELSFRGRDEEGLVSLELKGSSGFNYTVEASANLIDWQPIAVLVNTDGIVPFIDRQSTNSTARFYRAVGY